MATKTENKSLMAVKAAMNARMPIMLVGAPGTGKTSAINAIAEEMEDYKLITLIGSRMEPTDISGLPKAAKVADDDEGKPIYGTVNLATWWQVQILTHKKIILFLDEFSNTSNATRASFLSFLQDREFPNGQKVPDETIIIGAMNPTEEAADGYELDTPTTNRLFFMSWNPTVDEWIQGMLTNWNKPASKAEMKWKKIIARFIKDNPTWLHKPNNDVETTNVYGVNSNDYSEMEVLRSAWASRRSWDNLSRVWAETPNETYVQDVIAQGIVGYPAAAAFRDWLRKNEGVVSPQEVLDNPTNIDWNEMNINDSNLIFRAIVEMINNETVLKVYDVIEAVADSGNGNLIGPYISDIIEKSTSNKIDKNLRDKATERFLELTPKILEYVRNV